MTMMLLIAGVQFVILGVMGEYVGRAFLSANGKPQGVVRQAIGPGAALVEDERRDAA
jgi:undecaprenyl-phosphate 4-deoxy-4-formamido-L-arabinose transferase